VSGKRTQTDGDRDRLFWKTNHRKAVADPKATPATGTAWHVNGLTVDSDDIGRDVADRTATDERRDLIASHGHHRQSGGRRQPERLVVATGVVADVIEVAEDEWHRAEPLKTRSRCPCVTDHYGHSFHQWIGFIDDRVSVLAGSQGTDMI